jgi:crossover junction endodeoxyribonuclease RuvC
MIILGVDPGSTRTGYGLIACRARARHELLDQGVLAPSARLPLPERLRIIHDGIRDLIATHRPDILAVEDVFHAINTRTALVLGHVRGVVLLAGAAAGLPVATYPPATVKMQVTGSGRADKTQVAYMISRHLKRSFPSKASDASDAVAVALCHAFVQYDGRTVH